MSYFTHHEQPHATIYDGSNCMVNKNIKLVSALKVNPRIHIYYMNHHNDSYKKNSKRCSSPGTDEFNG